MSWTASGEKLDLALEEIVARLKEHRILADVPPEELAWIAAHGVLNRFPANALILRHDQPVEDLVFILSGHMAIYVDRGEGPHKVLEWRSGDVSGLLPYSRMKSSPGDTMAVEETEALTVSREYLPDLIRECPQLTARLVHVMLDRTRAFTSSDLHDEKMKSLGKLAAGLAHELNNPASAVVRSAKLLVDGLVTAEAASRGLVAAQLTSIQREAVDSMRAACLIPGLPATRSALEAADRVDAITGWLEAHGADVAAAAPLADSAVTLPSLDHLAQVIEGRVLNFALQRVAHDCANRSLAKEIETSASRIYELVSVVKGFTYLDRETAIQSVNVGQDLVNTLTVLRAKVKARSAKVDVAVEPGLPLVSAYGGELNQVWLNLIDNALDAVAPGGHVEVSAKGAAGRVVVQIVDDGPGIPDAVLPRIFDPFFTTKPVGQGTGLGLDIARRLVNRHSGSIEVDSHPGHTVFRVTLPITAAH